MGIWLSSTGFRALLIREKLPLLAIPCDRKQSVLVLAAIFFLWNGAIAWSQSFSFQPGRRSRPKGAASHSER